MHRLTPSLGLPRLLAVLDLCAQLERSPHAIRVGRWDLCVEAVGLLGTRRELGVVLRGYSGTEGKGNGPRNYLDDLLLRPEHCEATCRIVERFGLLVCRGIPDTGKGYRDVRGRSSRGRLSQGEYYHHDGCSGPMKPRIVEIRLPQEGPVRHVATAIAPFVNTVPAMLQEVESWLELRDELRDWKAKATASAGIPVQQLDRVQGLVNRAVRRDLSAEDARAFFRAVDRRSYAFFERWERGESRLICNAHVDGKTTSTMPTMQHRRAYLSTHRGGLENGKLVKRWPLEEMF